MRKVLTMALAGVLALGLGSAAFAVECALDVVPASTLLFPFVSYDYEQGAIDNSGQTTLIAITNVSSDAQIVHITVWTDYSIAILDFNLTLTGYDVQTINIRDILRDGNLPSETFGGANEWWDGVLPSNAGPTPFDDGPYSSFNQLWSGALDGYLAPSPVGFGLPIPEPTGTPQGVNCDPAIWVSSPINYRAPTGTIPAGTLDLFQGYLQASQLATTTYRNCDWTADIVFTNGTWFTNQDPRATWMYITADVVGACNKDLPDSDAVSYFGDTGFGVVTANVLMGDVLWLDSGNNFSEADNAVHLEANSLTVPDFGSTSFYQRYHNQNGLQVREPLPTAWAFRYMKHTPSGTHTWIRAWKGGTTSSIVVDLNDTGLVPGGSIAGPGPDFLYANSCIPYTYYAWDEDENVNSVEGDTEPPWSGGPANVPIPVPNLFPLETQEVSIDQFFIVDLDADGNTFGWMMVIWPLSNWDGVNPSSTVPPYDAYQTWMGVKYASGQYTAGLSAAVMANYNCDDTQVLPGLGIGR
jgi:hypothetical protein